MGALGSIVVENANQFNIARLSLPLTGSNGFTKRGQERHWGGLILLDDAGLYVLAIV